MSSHPPSATPATGLPPGVSRGPLGSRVLAQLVDLVVPAVVVVASTATGRSLGGGGATASTLVGTLLVVAWFVLVWWLVATRAASPGMRVLKLQLVGLRDGRPIGWARFLVRSLVLVVLTLSVVGLVLMLLLLVRHPRRQGWHDLAVHSVVIRERALAPGRSGRASASSPVAAKRAAAVPETDDPAFSGRGPAAPAPVGPTPVDPYPAQRAPSGPGPAPTPGADATPADTDIEDSVRLERRTDGSPPATPAGDRPAPRAEDLGAPGAGRAAPVQQGWVLVLDDGQIIDVTRPILLGRRPEAGSAEEEGAELVEIVDVTRTVSKTHLLLEVGADGLSVTDRGSTNGSTVTGTDGSSTGCVPGESTPVTDGTIVSFGDHYLTVHRRA